LFDSFELEVNSDTQKRILLVDAEHGLLAHRTLLDFLITIRAGAIVKLQLDR
jgi:hypothetical protein